MSRPGAFWFLCGCLSLDQSQARRDELRRTVNSGAIQWEIFIKVASENMIAPAVLDAFRNKGIEDALPSDVIDFFDGIAVLNRLRNEKIRAEALQLAKVFNDLNVIPIFLKGGANLMSGLYANPAHRVMVDLDVLVPVDRLSDCVAGLAGKGYNILVDNDFPAHHHYPPLARPNAAASVELHVEPLDKPYRSLLDPSEIFDEAVMLHQGLAKLAVPSPQCRLIHAIAHTQLANHSYIYGQLPLREFVDFALFDQSYKHAIDWKRIVKRFSDFGAATALAFHLLAAERLLDVRIDENVGVPAMAKVFYRRAEWQTDHPKWLIFSIKLLRPWLLLWRSFSHPILKQRLFRNLRDRAWYSRQWRIMRGQR